MEKEFKICTRLIEKIYRHMPGVPLQQVLIFLKIVEEPGITMPELSEGYGLTIASVSRSVRALNIYLENGKKRGFGLVRTAPDLHNPRCLACFLTAKGKALRDELKFNRGKNDM